MRQHRGPYGVRFVKPKIKSETEKAYLFELKDGETHWIPKKWVLGISNKKQHISVKDYWSTEMVLKGFVKK